VLKNGITIIIQLFVIASFGQRPRLVIPIGHTSTLTSVQFSHNGKLILTASKDNTAKLWDAVLGKLLRNLKGHLGEVNLAEFSPDGKRIVSASSDGTAMIWDVLSGKLLNTLKGHTYGVYSAHFSIDGKKIVTASIDGTAMLWNVLNGKLLKTFGLQNIHTLDYAEVYSAKLSPNEKFLTTVNSDGIDVWDVTSGKLLRKIKAMLFSRFWQFSDEGKLLTFLSDEKTVNIIDLNSGRLTNSLKSDSLFITKAQFSPDGKLIGTSTINDSIVRLWDADSGKLLKTLTGHRNEIVSIQFSKDAKMVLTASMDSTLKLWDINSGKLQYNWNGFSTGFDDTFNQHIGDSPLARFNPNGKTIVIALSDNTVTVNNIVSGKSLNRLRGYAGKVDTAYFNPDGEITIDIVSEDSREGQSELEENTDVRLNSYSPDGRLVAILDEFTDNQTVIVCMAVSGKKLYALKIEGPTYFNDVGFSPNGKWIFTKSGSYKWGYRVDLWDANSGKRLYMLEHDFTEQQGNYIHAIMFTPDEKRVVTASQAGTAIIWSLASGKKIAILKGHNEGARTVVCDSSGKVIVTTSGDFITKIWDAKSGSLIRSIDINGLITDINFSRNRILAVENSETKLFDISTGNHIASFYSIDSVDKLTLLPNGYYKANSKAAKLLHYVTKDLKVITFEQLDVKYNRPDKVLEAIGNTDTALIKSYRKAWEKRIKKLSIDTTTFREGYSVPEADFANRDDIEYDQKNSSLKLHIKGLDSSYKLDRFNIWVNETPVYGQRGVSIRKKNVNTFDTTISIQLSQGENRIETSISNVNGTESYRMPLQVNYTSSVKEKEKTYFIGIGIDCFADSTHNLQYSAKDIRDLGAKLKEKYGDDIILKTLFNADVTIENVKTLKDSLKKSSVNDRVIVAYSGHGMLSKEYDYYLSTYSVNFEKPEENGLPYDELENLLDSIPARKKLLLIDACHSGEVDKDELFAMNKTADSLGLKTKGVIVVGGQQQRVGLKNSFELMQSLFVNVGKNTGAIIISAAAGNQYALEGVNNLPNGIFTYSILEAMQKYPSIKISELKKIVGERVEELTKGLQKPTSRNETIAVDWNVW